MAEREFKAVVLDLFDTLVTWDPAKLPLFEWGTRAIHSTIPWILPRVEEALGAKYSRDAFVRTYSIVYEEINAERAREDVEITCFERFDRTLARLGLENRTAREALAQSLTRIHMSGVRKVTAAPRSRIAAVRRLAKKYRLGLLSNFDDSRTGREIVSDTGVGDLFETIIISANVGLRKPNPKIFERMLAALGLQPREVLFVGDTAHDDVAGSKSVGMSAAWISRHGHPLPQGLPAADYIISDLAELPEVLENSLKNSPEHSR